MTRGERSGRLRSWLQLLGPFLGLAFVLLVFWSADAPNFLSFYNFKTVSVQTVIVGLGAIGMTFVIVSGGIDLSIGSVIALASVVVAILMRDGHGAGFAALAGVATGAVCGAINGLLITGLRIVPFIATLGMFGMARGFAKYLAGEQKVNGVSSWIEATVAKTPEPGWVLLPPAVWLLFLFALLMGFVLRNTTLGVHTFALGSNEDTARLCGVHVGRTKVLVYTLCGLFAGLAGVFQYGRLNSVGDPTAALGKELDIIAAVVIGGGSLAGGEGRILGSLVGAFLMAYLANGCNLTGIPNYVQEIIIGGIIVAAVALDRLRHRREAG